MKRAICILLSVLMTVMPVLAGAETPLNYNYIRMISDLQQGRVPAEELVLALLEELTGEMFFSPRDGFSVSLDAAEASDADMGITLQYDADKQPGLTYYVDDDRLTLDAQAIRIKDGENTVGIRLEDAAEALLLEMTGLTALPQIQAEDIQTLVSLVSTLLGGISEEAVRFDCTVENGIPADDEAAEAVPAGGAITLTVDMAALKRDLVNAVTILLTTKSVTIDDLLTRYGEVLRLLIPDMPLTSQELLVLWVLARPMLPEMTGTLDVSLTWTESDWAFKAVHPELTLDVAWQQGRFLAIVSPPAGMEGVEPIVLADSRDLERLAAILSDIGRGISSEAFRWEKTGYSEDLYLNESLYLKVDTTVLRQELKTAVTHALRVHADTYLELQERYWWLLEMVGEIGYSLRAHMRSGLPFQARMRLEPMVQVLQHLNSAAPDYLAKLVTNALDYAIPDFSLELDAACWGIKYEPTWRCMLAVNGTQITLHGNDCSFSGMVQRDEAYSMYTGKDQPREWAIESMYATLDAGWNSTGFTVNGAVYDGDDVMTATVLGTLGKDSFDIRAYTGGGEVDLTLAGSGQKAELTGTIDRTPVAGMLTWNDNGGTFSLSAGGDQLIKGALEISDSTASLMLASEDVILRAAYHMYGMMETLQINAGDFWMTLQREYAWTGPQYKIQLPQWRAEVSNSGLRVEHDRVVQSRIAADELILLQQGEETTLRYAFAEGDSWGVYYKPGLLKMYLGNQMAVVEDLTWYDGDCLNATSVTLMRGNREQQEIIGELRLITHLEGDSLVTEVWENTAKESVMTGTIVVDFSPEPYAPAEIDAWLTVEELRKTFQ